ncbi:unnamed protein product [Absidia cylindrospora]
MTSKATQEYQLSFIKLISQLSEIERKGEELFDNIRVAYLMNWLQHKLLGSLQVLENDARKCGLLSISGVAPGESQTHPARNLATRTTETAQLVDAFYQEKNRLLMNIRAAATAATSSSTSIGGPPM